MSFEDIKDLLSKYHQYLSHKDEEFEKIHKIVVRVLNAPVSGNDLTITKGELRIKGGSVVQNELFLHREKILQELRKNGVTTITEIR